MLVNTPATFGGMGLTTNLFPSMTLGSGSAGDGITSDNVSPMNLIYVRKVGYGVRTVNEIDNENSKEGFSLDNIIQKKDQNIENMETLQRILNEAISVMDSSSDI